MNVNKFAGLVFINSFDDELGKLTIHRSKSAVPFGGSFRIIDFALSSLSNAGISNVGFITTDKYRSILDHIGTGRWWNLDRKSGGIHLMSPYSTNTLRRSDTYLEGLMGAKDFIERSNAEHLVIFTGGIAANLDIDALCTDHLKNNADITVMYSNTQKPLYYTAEECALNIKNGKIGGVLKGANVDNYPIGVYVIKLSVMNAIIHHAQKKGYEDINIDKEFVLNDKYSIYAFEHSGFVAFNDSIQNYFDANMAILDSYTRKELFNADRPIYTKIKSDMPTRYGTRSIVKNSFIADGCIIEGVVRNCILGRCVHIGKGAVVENSIIIQGSRIGEDAEVKYCILDKNVNVANSKTVKGSEGNVVVLPKNCMF